MNSFEQTCNWPYSNSDCTDTAGGHWDNPCNDGYSCQPLGNCAKDGNCKLSYINVQIENEYHGNEIAYEMFVIESFLFRNHSWLYVENMGKLEQLCISLRRRDANEIKV